MNRCAVCSIACERWLCPGCLIMWSISDAPCSQEGFEAWSDEERRKLERARVDGVFE